MCVQPWILTKDGIEYEVPCGTCYQCYLIKRQERSFRNLIEFNTHKYALFLTLTYSDEELNKLPCEVITGIVCNPPRNFQKYIKRLRKKYTLRYAACSEYGENTRRPHFHAIIYTNDVISYDVLREQWPYGYVKISEANGARIHYLTKYIDKYISTDIRGKMIDDIYRSYYQDRSLPAYMHIAIENYTYYINSQYYCSRKPALGSAYFTDSVIKKYHDYIMRTGMYPNIDYMGQVYKIPRYFINKILTDEERLQIYDEYRANGFRLTVEKEEAKRLGLELSEYQNNIRNKDKKSKKEMLKKHKVMYKDL